MKRKIIELKNPLLSTWSSESHFMSLILNQKGSMSWIFNNYINLIGHYFEDTKMITIGFFPRHDPTNPENPINAWSMCPFAATKNVSYDFINENFKDVISYVFEAIDDGYCIYLDLKQDFLDKKMSGNVHKTFVYGYDNNKKVVLVADHYNNGKYDMAEVEFEKFKLAFEKAYEKNAQIDTNKSYSNQNQVVSELRKIVLIKLREYNYTFNVEWFKMQLNDYINATYTLGCIAPVHKINNAKMYYGVSCYQLVIDYMYRLWEGKVDDLDWRCITLLCDHKKLMKKRIVYFYNNKICDITEKEIIEYENLEKQAQVLLNLFLKYYVKPDKEILLKIIDGIKKMKKAERVLLEELLNKI